MSNRRQQQQNQQRMGLIGHVPDIKNKAQQGILCDHILLHSESNNTHIAYYPKPFFQPKTPLYQTYKHLLLHFTKENRQIIDTCSLYAGTQDNIPSLLMLYIKNSILKGLKNYEIEQDQQIGLQLFESKEFFGENKQYYSDRFFKQLKFCIDNTDEKVLGNDRLKHLKLTDLHQLMSVLKCLEILPIQQKLRRINTLSEQFRNHKQLFTVSNLIKQQYIFIQKIRFPLFNTLQQAIITSKGVSEQQIRKRAQYLLYDILRDLQTVQTCTGKFPQLLQPRMIYCCLETKKKYQLSLQPLVLQTLGIMNPELYRKLKKGWRNPSKGKVSQRQRIFQQYLKIKGAFWHLILIVDYYLRRNDDISKTIQSNNESQDFIVQKQLYKMLLQIHKRILTNFFFTQFLIKWENKLCRTDIFNKPTFIPKLNQIQKQDKVRINQKAYYEFKIKTYSTINEEICNPYFEPANLLNLYKHLFLYYFSLLKLIYYKRIQTCVQFVKGKFVQKQFDWAEEVQFCLSKYIKLTEDYMHRQDKQGYQMRFYSRIRKNFLNTHHLHTNFLSPQTLSQHSLSTLQTLIKPQLRYLVQQKLSFKDTRKLYYLYKISQISTVQTFDTADSLLFSRVCKIGQGSNEIELKGVEEIIREIQGYKS